MPELVLSEDTIPSELAVGKLWPRMAAGGEDGNSLHVICVTTPTANGALVTTAKTVRCSITVLKTAETPGTSSITASLIG